MAMIAIATSTVHIMWTIFFNNVPICWLNIPFLEDVEFEELCNVIQQLLLWFARTSKRFSKRYSLQLLNYFFAFKLLFLW